MIYRHCYLELALTYTQICAFGPTNYIELTNLLYNSRKRYKYIHVYGTIASCTSTDA